MPSPSLLANTSSGSASTSGVHGGHISPATAASELLSAEALSMRLRKQQPSSSPAEAAPKLNETDQSEALASRLRNVQRQQYAPLGGKSDSEALMPASASSAGAEALAMRLRSQRSTQQTTSQLADPGSSAEVLHMNPGTASLQSRAVPQRADLMRPLSLSNAAGQGTNATKSATTPPDVLSARAKSATADASPKLDKPSLQARKHCHSFDLSKHMSPDQFGEANVVRILLCPDASCPT